MVEMIVSIALFLILCTLFISIQTKIYVSLARSIQYHHAVHRASRIIQGIRAGKQSIGIYSNKSYTAHSSIHSYTVPGKESMPYLQVTVSWPEKGSLAERSYTLAAYYSI